MNETDIQSQIIRDTRKIGGNGFKMNNRFMVGVPDLGLALPVQIFAFLEEKFIREVPKKLTTVPLDMTALQRKWMRDMKATGVRAKFGWLVATRVRDGEYICSFGSDLDAERASIDLGHINVMMKCVGQVWPVENIIWNLN